MLPEARRVLSEFKIMIQTEQERSLCETREIAIRDEAFRKSLDKVLTDFGRPEE
jgi:hypothetical protein